MPLPKTFSSSVERKLAGRLTLVLVIPFLGLALLATHQLRRTADEFNQEQLTREAKNYGMLLAERLTARIVSLANDRLTSNRESLEGIRLPLDVREDRLQVSLVPLGINETDETEIHEIAHDLDDIENMRRCVGVNVSYCAPPAGASQRTWQLRLVTLFDTNASLYVSTWIPEDSALLEDSLLLELFPPLAALLLVLAVYVGVLSLRHRLKPISELQAAVFALERGELGFQVARSTDDEFGSLGDAFNNMSLELEQSFGFQSIVAEIDEAIMSSSETRSVYHKCAVALRDYCGIKSSMLVVEGPDHWRCFQLEEDHVVLSESASEPAPGPNMVKLPILHDTSVLGWVLLDKSACTSDSRLLEVIRKLSVGMINIRRSETLYQQANYDSLTGLLNRNAFSHELARRVRQTDRSKKHGALAFLDLDSFKKVNDGEGHSAGDALLKIVAQRLSDVIRNDDIVARLGGDEFAIVLGAYGSEEDLVHVLQRILDSFVEPIRIGTLELQVHVSMGVCVFPRDGDTVEGLLKKADIAMYRAKPTRGNSFEFYNQGLNEDAERQLKVEARLGKAIRSGEIELFLQPKLELESGLITSCEALSRWVDDDLGFVPPDEFISVAERSGLIHDLTERVFERVGEVLNAFPALLTSIAINISPQEINRAEFTDDLLDYVRKYRIPSSAVELEVTESNFMDDPEFVATVLRRIREKGFSVSLDDFGTGYSSLNILRKLPLDDIKIDKSFVDEITESKEARELIQKIIEIARNLGMGVVAEGVETENQLELLARMSCTYVQGYFISKPLPAYEAMEFVSNWNRKHTVQIVGSMGARV